jgi:HAD superfamily hydrolase (TIGR01509 family)
MLSEQTSPRGLRFLPSQADPLSVSAERNDRKSVEAVVFDLDGVLLDSEPISFRALRAFVAPGELTEAQYAALVGSTVEHTLEWVRVTYGRTEPYEELRQLSSEYLYRELESAVLEPLDGAAELVAAVLERGHRVAVASQSSRRWVEASLRAIGLDGHISTLITAAEVARGKPAPDIYLRAAEMLGTPPEACLAIEDSQPGVAAGVAAGMRVVQLRATSHAAPPQPDVLAVIDSLRDFDLAWLG